MKETGGNKEKPWDEVPIGTKKTLDHEAWPGYRLPFYLTVAAGVVYLALTLLGVFSH